MKATIPVKIKWLLLLFINLGVTLSTVTVKTVLIEEPRKSHYLFQCFFDFGTTEALYQIKWFVNNYQIHNFSATAWSPRFTNETALTEEKIKDHGYKTVGFHIHCSVICTNTSTESSLTIVSPEIFIGIKVPDSMTVKNGEEVKLQLKVPIPFGCGPDQNLAGGCDLYVELEDGNGKTNCATVIHDHARNDAVLWVRGLLDETVQEGRSELILRTLNYRPHEIWGNYSLNVKIIVMQNSSQANTAKDNMSSSCERKPPYCECPQKGSVEAPVPKATCYVTKPNCPTSTEKPVQPTKGTTADTTTESGTSTPVRCSVVLICCLIGRWML